MTMKSVDLPHLRSVVLAGHAGAGKTTLAEQLLFKAGAIPRLGKVDDGTAHLDFEPEEQKRRESLSLAVGTFEYDGTRISLVDTPGYPDFVRRRHRRVRRLRWCPARHGRLGRRRSRARAGRARWPGHEHRDLLLHQQVRPGERQPERGARCAPFDVRQQDRGDPAGDRGGRCLQRATSTSSTARPIGGTGTTRSRSRSPTSWPTRSRAGGISSSRPPRRPTTTS